MQNVSISVKIDHVVREKKRKIKGKAARQLEGM